MCYLAAERTKDNTQLTRNSLELFTWGKAEQMLNNF